MNKKNFQQQVNDLAPYSQINKAFRHAYGVNAAAVLAFNYKFKYFLLNSFYLFSKTTATPIAIQIIHHFKTTPKQLN